MMMKSILRPVRRAIDFVRSTSFERFREFECPGEEQREGKADDPDPRDEGEGPGRQVQGRRDGIRDLDDDPGEHCIGDAHAKDVAAPELLEEFKRHSPGS